MSAKGIPVRIFRNQERALTLGKKAAITVEWQNE
jgi:hypothetical protein